MRICRLSQAVTKMVAGGGAGAGSTTKSRVKILANIFISFIGAGVLGLPYAFKESGVLEGIIIMTFVAVVSTKAMLMLVDCKYLILNSEAPKLDSELGVVEPFIKHASTSNGSVKSLSSEEEVNDDTATIFHHSVNQSDNKHHFGDRELTYGDVGYKALGSVGRGLVDASILISQVGFCCAYLIFITENLSTYVEHLSKYHWLVIILPPLFFLTLLRDLSSLAISSLFAQFSNLFAFLVVFWFDFDHAGKVRTHPKQMSLAGFPFFFAVAIYCYEGAGMILSLEASVDKSIRHKFKRYFVLTMLVVTTLYISFGACGYMSFGAETKEIITLNLPHSGSLIDSAMLVKLCLCLSLFFTYPVMMFPVSRLLEQWCQVSPTITANIGHCPGYVLRILLVSCTGLTVVAIPNFAHLMALVGATCCMLLGFVLPALFHLTLNGKNISLRGRCLDMFIIGLGVCGAIMGTIDALKRLWEDDEDDGGGVVEAVELLVTTVANVTSAAAAAAYDENQ